MTPSGLAIILTGRQEELRKTHQEAARVMQKGRLVHIDGAAHNLHHDQLKRTVDVMAEFLSTL